MKTNTIIVSVVSVILVIIIILTAYFIITERNKPEKGDKIIISQYTFPQQKATLLKQIEITDPQEIMEFERLYNGLVAPEKEVYPAILDEVIIEFEDGTRVYVELDRDNYCFIAKNAGVDENGKVILEDGKVVIITEEFLTYVKNLLAESE